MSARRIDRPQLRITRGAMILAGLEIGLSLVWLLSDQVTRARMIDWLGASPDSVWRHGRVWTLATSALIEVDFVGLLLHGVVLFMFVPTLERFWGTPRFLRFALITSVVGTFAGTAVGLAVGAEAPILGLNPFIYASIVAFGIVYARSPVQFFGVLPLTGRQMMFGFIGFLILFVGLQALWAQGAAFAAAMGVAALMTSKRWSPGLAWKRWQIARARAHLTVVPPPKATGPGGAGKGGKGKPDEKWLN
jgi:membrane associated rhomboid family serine protease